MTPLTENTLIYCRTAESARKQAIDIKLQDYDWSSLNDIFEEIEFAISNGWLHIEGVRSGDNQMINDKEKLILNILGYRVSCDYVLGYTIEW